MEIIDYIKWRGDLTFEERELNEVDSLIFCALSYEDFDLVFRIKDNMTIKELSKIFFSLYDEDYLKNRKTFSYRSYEILRAMASSKRYSSLIVYNYVNEINTEENSQFSALTIQYEKRWKYIVFRGTDDTIVGWKENFIMLYRDNILAQKKAVQYLKRATDDRKLTTFNKRMIYYLGGHSKGGHLAIYASIHMSHNVQKRIRRIDNFDGPGLKDELWNNDEFKYLYQKITTYLPEDSFFGRLFTNQGNRKIIKSKQNGLLQHSVYNWKINIDHINEAACLSQNSDVVINRTNELLDRFTKIEKKNIIDSLFSIFNKLDIHNISDVSKIDVVILVKVLKEIRCLDDQTKSILIEIIRLMRILSQ